uniref:Leucine-rich repeat-containing protein 75B n=1 Tax=Naja naja TaxID=35670 RepID=A0A8C6YEW3_NAJNA
MKCCTRRPPSSTWWTPSPTTFLMSLARDLQCPKKQSQGHMRPPHPTLAWPRNSRLWTAPGPAALGRRTGAGSSTRPTSARLGVHEYDPWKSSDRICRQLIYHLTPHSKWHRSGLPHRKSHSSLNSSLQKQLGQEAIHLSGVPLSTRDIQHLASYLQGSGDHLLTIDLSFTSLKDEEMRFLMPFLRSLPSLTHLSLNGNHLTRATVKDLTDAMKDMAKFPSLAWIDLGNNVDVSSMPQPLLVGLRKRLSQQTTLPTIYESLDCASEASSRPETSLLEEDLQGEEGIPPVAKHRFHQQSCER